MIKHHVVINYKSVQKIIKGWSNYQIEANCSMNKIKYEVSLQKL